MKNLFALFLLLSTSLMAQNKDETIIRNILHEQTKSWNKGDIDAFMHGYWQSDSLMFIGKNGVTYGYDKTRSNYHKNYPDTAAMGKLAFQILEVKPLSGDHYFVLGKWMLTRSIGNLSGHYTLIFRKIKGQWLIVSDHSS
jgi:ketosteroid isomerase-like protein